VKTSHKIVSVVEGTLVECMTAEPAATLDEVLQVLKDVTFIAETVAHTRGLERDILPTTDRARDILARFKPE